MDFQVISGFPIEGQLRYVEKDHSFDFIPANDELIRTMRRGRELTVGSLALSVDPATGEVLGVSGYCPRASWAIGRIGKPNFSRGRLWTDPERLPPIGVAHRILHLQDVAAIIDPTTQWIRVGLRASATELLVEFASGCVAELDGGQLNALWLNAKLTPS